MFFGQNFLKKNVTAGGIQPIVSINDDVVFWMRYVWFGKQNIPESLKLIGMVFTCKVTVWFRKSPDLNIGVILPTGNMVVNDVGPDDTFEEKDDTKDTLCNLLNSENIVVK